MIPADSPVTARVVLFGTDDAVARLTRDLSSGPADATLGSALRGLSAAVRETATREIATVGAGLLELDLGGLLVTGWQRYRALVEAGHRTAAAPGRQEIVDILTHRIGVSANPHVDLLVNDVRVATIHFGLGLEFQVRALTAVVRAGRIVALESGRCKVTASLSIEGVEVASRSAESDLRLLVHVGAGIPLVPEAPDVNAPPPGHGFPGAPRRGGPVPPGRNGRIR
ncbi:hypothetical protein GCM10029978_070600 [Actinoallomurus acanthiterrae]